MSNIPNHEQKMHLERLEKSPLFQVSLASKELFHSNLWAWLFMTPDSNDVAGIEYVKVFFPDFPDGPFKVRREYLNIDLVLIAKAKAGGGNIYYAIENKIKSVPNKNQLLEYDEKLNKIKSKPKPVVKGKLLTSILKPEFKLNEEWSSKRILEIAKGLKELVKREKGYRKYFILDYIEFIESMTAILEVGPKSRADEVYSFYGDNANGEFKELKQLRIHDLYLKRAGSNLFKYLNEELEKHDYDYEITANNGFNRGKYMCEFYFESKDEKFRIGIQIEGHQYRRYVWLKDHEKEFIDWSKSEKKDSQLLPDFVKSLIADEKYSWFVENPKAQYGCNMRKQFCFYKPCFLYQYELLGDKKRFEDIAEMLKEDLDKAQKIMKNFNPQSVG